MAQYQYWYQYYLVFREAILQEGSTDLIPTPMTGTPRSLANLTNFA